MKRILFLFTAGFSFLACSNDDENVESEQNSYKIKKLSKTFYVEDGTSYRLDYNYNKSGKITKWVQENHDGTLTHDDYLYNSQGQILESKTTNITQNKVIRTISYIYDTSNRISTVTFLSSDGSINTSHFSYENNTVFIIDDLGGNKKLSFNATGKLLNTVSSGTGTDPLNGNDNRNYKLYQRFSYFYSL